MVDAPRFLDAVAYVDIDPDVRIARLIARHVGAQYSVVDP